MTLDKCNGDRPASDGASRIFMLSYPLFYMIVIAPLLLTRIFINTITSHTYNPCAEDIKLTLDEINTIVRNSKFVSL